MVTVTIDSKTVRFKPLSIDGMSNSEIIDKACEKIYGKGAFFWEDCSNKFYGQVCKPIKRNPNTNNCITGVILVRVDRG